MDELKQWTVDLSASGGRAYISDESGTNVATVERRVWANDAYRTTEEDWKGVVDLIAAAPEMLAVLKRVVADAWGDSDRVEAMVNAVEAVIAKAEPPRKVKVRLTFEVEVERQENDFQTTARARDEVLVCGNGRCVEQEIVSLG